MGAYDDDCDDVSGQCRCKPGITGITCDQCLPGFWGFSPNGCTSKPKTLSNIGDLHILINILFSRAECFPCEQPGHICDPDTGRCICPTLTIGKECEKCAPGTWSYHPYKGCQYCQCHNKGSVSEQCDLDSGSCRCLKGFEGEKCDQCSNGHYNFPYCWPCNCNANGTKATACQDSSCSCNQNGDCFCKELVEGKKCGKIIVYLYGRLH